MNDLVQLRWILCVGLGMGVGACGKDSEPADSDGGTETDGGTDTAGTDSAATAPTSDSQTASETMDSDSDSDSDTSPTDPSTGTDSAGTDSAGTDSAGTDSAGTDSAGTDSAGTDSAGTDSADTGGTGAAGYNVSGTFSRAQSAFIYAGNDGIGDAYLGLLETCAEDAVQGEGTIVMDADISDTATMVEFTIENVPDGTWHLAGFFDDNENADPNDPFPDQGDFATSENLAIGCVEVVVDGADVTGVELVYNQTVPF